MPTLAPRLQAAPLWTPLAALALAGAWLIPNTSPPWVAFHKDFWAACVLGLVALVVGLRAWRDRHAVALDPFAGALALLAAATLAQWAAGRVHFFGHAALGAAYFLGAAAMLCVGRAWEEREPGGVARLLFPAFVLGALGTAALVFKQWLGWDGLDVYTHGLGAGQRPFGNMLQPNNAATLLQLGVVGLVAFGARQRLAAVAVTLLALPLVFALVLTQSRIGYLAFVLLLGLGVALGGRLFGARLRWALVALAVFFVAAVLLLPTFNGWLGQEVALLQRTQNEQRWQVWRGFLAAALQHPWAGFGFAPGITPQLAAADAGYAFRGLFTWSHNAFLDVALWYGIPAALALIAVCAWALARLLRAPLTTGHALYAGALLPLGLHGMVELPLAYAYFLLPFALLAGALSAQLRLPALRLDPRALMATLALLAATLAVVGRDYLEIERGFYSWRFKMSRVGLHHPLDLPETLLLSQYRAYLVGMRLPPGALDAQAREDFARAVELEASPAALQAIVLALVQAGELEAARGWVEAARRVTESEQRRALAAAWQARAAQDSRLAAIAWPE